MYANANLSGTIKWPQYGTPALKTLITPCKCRKEEFQASSSTTSSLTIIPKHRTFYTRCSNYLLHLVQNLKVEMQVLMQVRLVLLPNQASTSTLSRLFNKTAKYLRCHSRTMIPQKDKLIQNGFTFVGLQITCETRHLPR